MDIYPTASKLGGMGIVIFADIGKTEYQNSRNITDSLTKLLLEQSTNYNINREKLAKLENNIKKEKLQRNAERLQSLVIDLPINKIRLNEINQEKVASILQTEEAFMVEEYKHTHTHTHTHTRDYQLYH